MRWTCPTRRSLLALTLVAILAGCGDPKVLTPSGHLREEVVTLDDGQTVTCLIYDRDRGGALDCDWNAQ